VTSLFWLQPLSTASSSLLKQLLSSQKFPNPYFYLGFLFPPTIYSSISISLLSVSNCLRELSTVTTFSFSLLYSL
jgi:hypothetical protein